MYLSYCRGGFLNNQLEVSQYKLIKMITLGIWLAEEECFRFNSRIYVKFLNKISRMPNVFSENLKF